MSLLLPDGYAELSPEDKARICNGCGPAGDDFKSRLICELTPDHLLGVDFGEACNVHDYEYSQGQDRLGADNRLMINMLICCAEQRPEMLGEFTTFALAYHAAVRAGGAEHFGGQA